MKSFPLSFSSEKVKYILCTDGCCMIDRRMGTYGYPIEIQALFFMAMKCALSVLKKDLEGKAFFERIEKRLHALTFHLRTYFRIDQEQLNDIYRFKTEEYSDVAVNKFNVIPDSIPEWIFGFMLARGGYFVGNVSPGRMDFRWFAFGQLHLNSFIVAMESHEWRIVTGCNPKNPRWSYHNGGSWPVLLWLLTAACFKSGRPHFARRAIELAETRLLKDQWPEFYDGRLGRFIWKQAQKFQTWSIAGYLVAKMLLENPSHLSSLSLEEDKAI
ncbi:hypothetical protein TIFTF001_017844 [Ficus carica]|uniref:Alkaline/neutral invertase n=1 Tax=Ficus carica TaxID=3494 RepID=A0AA88D7C6_FICCA|nr:hypothetical protein TIFTF001_017844 [Ficus carica]